MVFSYPQTSDLACGNIKPGKSDSFQRSKNSATVTPAETPAERGEFPRLILRGKGGQKINFKKK
jgi:hypothetical protein